MVVALLGIVLIGVMFISLILRKVKFKHFFISLLVGIGMFLFGAILDNNNSETKQSDNSETNIEESFENNSSGVIDNFSINDKQQLVIDSLNDFGEFASNYKSLPLNERTPLWDREIYNKEVTWKGNIIEIGGNRVYIIDNSKYKEGMTWDEVAGTENEYYVFVAQFDNKILKEAFTLGAEDTFTGKLQSRGNDSGFYSHWKLYNSQRGK